MRWRVEVITEPTTTSEVLVSNFFDNIFPGRFPIGRAGSIIFRKLFGQASGKFSKESLLALAISEDGKVVGTMSANYKEVIQGGKALSFFEMGDTFTHPKYRKEGNCAEITGDNYLDKSVFGRLFYELETKFLKNVDFLYGLPNKEAMQAWVKHAGFVEYCESNLTGVVYYPKFSVQNTLSRFRVFKDYKMCVYGSNRFAIQYLDEIGLGCDLELSQRIQFYKERFFSSEESDYLLFSTHLHSREVFIIGREKNINGKNVLLVCGRFIPNSKDNYAIFTYFASLFRNYDRVVMLSSAKQNKLGFSINRLSVLRLNPILISVKPLKKKDINLKHYFEGLEYSDTDLV